MKVVTKILMITLLTYTFAVSDTLQQGVAIEGSVAKGEIEYYKFYGFKGDTVILTLDSLEDDADLYVNLGALPKGNTNDTCYSWKSHTSVEECVITLSKNQYVYINVAGYKGTPYRLGTTVNSSVDVLEKDKTISGGVHYIKQYKYYKIDVQAGDELRVDLTQQDADADLYVKFGSKPERYNDNYDCVSKNGLKNDETCTLEISHDGTVYIGVQSWKCMQNVQYKIKATLTHKEKNVAPEITTTADTYKPNKTVSINIDGTLSGDQDWAAIYRVGDNNDWGNVIAWNWVSNSTTELNIIKQEMPAGEYEIRLFLHNSYTVEATHRFAVSDNDAVVPYTPDALPTNMLANEAMNMNPNHPRFNHWINPENISNGTLNLVAQYDHSSYTLPRDIWLPHHKYTVVWDMETTGHVGMDTFPVVRFNSLGYFSQGYQNSILNQKETLYTVIASKDDLNSNSYKSFSFYLMHALPNSRVKISNIRIYEGVIEIEKPTLKDTNFQGSMTMDKEGVFRRNGSVVFPITIYKANDLITRGARSAEQYIAQGITGTLIEAHSEHWYDAREDRISKMITAGMTTMSIPITNYLKYPTYALGTYYFSDFINIMHTFEQDNQMWDSITTLTIDNEFYHQNQQFKESINAIRDSIPHKPIQMLNGVEAISAWYNDYIDITGTYISNDNEVNSNHPEATTNIHLLEAQRLTPNLHVPATLLQINQGTAENFGSILMAGVALGGTKLEYWKDSDELFNGFRNLAMPTLPMWNQLPTLRTYLDKMCDLGIIETTPYIGFKVKQTNDKYEYIKARLDKNNKAYVIASNMTSLATPRTVVFNQNYTGLHYVPSGNLKDIMTGEVKGSIDPLSKKINITLAPHTWVVLEVEKK